MFEQNTKNLYAFALITKERKLVIVRNGKGWMIPIAEESVQGHDALAADLVSDFFADISLKNRHLIAEMPEFWWNGKKFTCYFYEYEFSGKLRDEKRAFLAGKESLVARVFPEDVWNLITYQNELESRLS